MLESIVANILNRSLGAYVENFDPKQLNIGIWSGDVTLSNLKLKPESLDKLNLPIELKCGNLGTLTMQIPWSNLKSKPVKVLIQDCYVLISAKLPNTFDQAEEKIKELRIKRQKLVDLEAISQSLELSSLNLNPNEALKNQSFTDSLVSKIIDNLQITIKNIHVRYEDFACYTKSPYSLGITLEELSAVSTNENWVENFIEQVSTMSRKLMLLKSLSIYMDTSLTGETSVVSGDKDQMIESLKSFIHSASSDNRSIEYLLQPVSGSGHLTLSKLGATDEHPHYNLDLFFDQFRMNLNRSQYSNILDTTTQMAYVRKVMKFKKTAPQCSIRDDPYRWLQYSFQTVYNEIHERNYKKTWEYMKQRRDERKAYIPLWKKHLVDPNSLTPDEKNELDQLEICCEYEDLKFYRSLAKVQYLKEYKTLPKKQEPQQNGWFSSWWGGNRAANNEASNKIVDDATNSDSIQITREQMNEFYEAIEFDDSKELSDLLEVPRERVHLAVDCKLNTGSFIIRNTKDSNSLAEFISQGCHMEFLQRKDSYFVGFKLNKFFAEDGSKDILYKHIVSVKQLSTNSSSSDFFNNDPFFQVSFENNPLNESADSELIAKLSSMTIFHNPKFIEEIYQFFKPPQGNTDTIGSLMNAAESTIQDFTKQTKIGLQYAFEEHKTMNCQMDLQAPLIILPIDPNKWDTPVGILDAGHISIMSDLISQSKYEEIKNEQKDSYTEEDWKKLNTYMFDKYTLSLHDAQIFIGPDIKSTIEQLHTDGDKNALILDHLDMNLLIELSIIPLFYELPKIKISGGIPHFRAMLSDYQYMIFMDLLSVSIPNFDDFTDSTNVAQYQIFDGNDAESIDIFTDAQPDLFESTTNDNKYAVDLVKLINSPDSLVVRQHEIELNFTMDLITLSLKRCSNTSTFESETLVDVIGEKLDLSMYTTLKEIQLDLQLADLSVNDHIETSPINEFNKLMGSNRHGDHSHENLFVVSYSRTLRYANFKGETIECFDQDIKMDISDFQVVLTRKSILTLFNYSLNTFTDPMAPEVPSDKLRHNDEQNINAPAHINLDINMKSINMILNDDGIKLATLTLDKADISLFMLPDSMRLKSKIGGLNLIDNDIHEGRKLISIQGDDLADLYYETYDVETNTLPYTSLVRFESRSMIFNVFEDSFSRIYEFINHFQRMKYIYDAARDAALDQATNVDSPDKIMFDILVRAPIFVFPKPVDPADDVFDSITLNLGEIHTSNEIIEKDGIFFNMIKAGLSNTKILSSFVVGENYERQDLEIIDKLDINFDIDYYEGDTHTLNRSKMIINGNLQGNEIKLTELQAYTMLQISQTVPRIFQNNSVNDNEIEDIQNDATNANLLLMRDKSPERTELSADNQISTQLTTSEATETGSKNIDNLTVELTFHIPILCLSLYSDTTNIVDISSHALSQFSLNELTVSFQMAENGDYDSDFHIRSFVVKDVRESKKNIFTDIIPEVNNNGYQFVSKITKEKKNSTVDLTIDSPTVILAMDYLFAVKKFADYVTRKPKSITYRELTDINYGVNIDQALEQDYNKYDDDEEQIQNSINYIINIFNPSILLLANPELKESDAIVLRITQILLCISDVNKINAFGIGMFLKNMATNSKLRILNDFSFDFAMDDRGSDKTSFLTSISSNIQPLLLRLSLRDVYLALEIFNKASAMYNDASNGNIDGFEPITDVASLAENVSQKISEYAPSIISTLSRGSNKMQKKEKELVVIVKAERLKIKFEGFRVVVIGDVHELPILDFDVDGFEINARNWSTELEADTQIKTLMNIFNYSCSQWEPLLEPWLFSVLVEKSKDGKVAVNVISREAAEFTVTSRAIATISHFANLLTKKDGLKERGQDSPFMIINETGYDLKIWIDDGSDERAQLTTVKNEEFIPWSFEDWRLVREKLSINNNLNFIGVEFIDSVYEPIRKVSLKNEGEAVFMLEPKLFDHYHNRLACEIKLGEDKVKNVILKSTVSIQNNTPTPIHVGVGNFNREFVVDREIIIPSGTTRAIPIDYVYTGTFAVRPEIQTELFGWSIAKLQGADTEVDLNWENIRDEDLILECPKLNNTDGPADFYYYKMHADYDTKHPLNKLYPYMNIMVSPPLVLENLLPYDIDWKLFQKGPRKWTDGLKQGEKCPVHVIDMNFSVVLKIEILHSKYSLSNASIINTPTALTTVDEEITLKSSDGQRLSLRLYYSYDPKYGTKVSIYAPYLFINRTGKTLQVIDRFNSITMNGKHDEEERPEMFSFGIENDAFDFLRGNLAANTVRVKIGDSYNSESFSIDKIGQSFEVSAALKIRNFENNIGVHINEGTGKYNFTKVISIQPRFIIKNDLDLPVYIGMVGSLKTVYIPSSDISPIYELPSFCDKQLTVGFREGQENMSAAFVVNNIGEVYLRVKKLTSNAHMLLRVVISADHASIFVNIIDAKNLWPYSIRNFSDQEFFIYQSDPNIDKEGNRIIEDEVFKPIFYKIPPKSVMPYAWDYPAAEVKELVLRCSNRERYIQLAEIGSLMPMRVKHGESSQIFDLNVIADGPIQALMISNYDPRTSIYQLRNSGSNNSLHTSTTNVGNVAVKEEFETNIKDENYFFNFVLNFEGFGVSLVNTKNNKNEELCYTMIRGIEVRYNESEIYQTASMKLKWVQIDNQLYSCIYPVVLFPTVISKSRYDLNRHPVFSASISRLKDDAHGVTYIKFATMLLQELSIQVDEDFLWALLDFSKIPGASWSLESNEDQLWDNNTKIPEPPTIRSMNDLYFEGLHLQPLQFNISFVRTEKVDAEDTMNLQNALSLATDILTMAIGNINDAPVRLSALLLENIRTPYPYLIQNITEHYKQAFLYQLYKVLGSADVLGNPVGLFNNISSGVMDIFYEPYQGYIMTDRPQDLGIGLAKGGLSFLKKSVFGVSDSVSRFTDSVAKGLTVASMDKNFQEKRRLQRQQRNNVNNSTPVDGFSRGATSLFTGISSGIAGLAIAPMEGATREGTSGFIKGLGKGLLGLPTKTATGFLDMANNISESIRNTTTAFDGKGVDKIRLPRYIPKDGSIIVYDKRQAQGQYWMKKFWNDDYYIGHIKIQGERICLVTFVRISIINIGTSSVEEEIKMSDVVNITSEKAGVRIRCKNGYSRLVNIEDKSIKRELYGYIAVAVTEYNKNCIVAL